MIERLVRSVVGDKALYPCSAQLMMKINELIDHLNQGEKQYQTGSSGCDEGRKPLHFKAKVVCKSCDNKETYHQSGEVERGRFFLYCQKCKHVGCEVELFNNAQESEGK